ncbi:hypothetical protein [Nocardia anaemiae]|uniref:hypothetical protein n=1 Tax=Nocardia anaemiae TaxID=263910 RepID=UPI000B111199|nr:hypothetical protein [Nocardia anaemiae]
MWISRLFRDGSGRIVKSVLEYAEKNKELTTDKTGKIRRLLDEVDARDVDGSSRVRKSIGDGVGSTAETPSTSLARPSVSDRKFATPDLSSIPPLGDFIRGAAADDKNLLATLSGFNGRYGPYDVRVSVANYLHDAEGFTYHASVWDPDKGMIGILERKIYRDEHSRIVVENRMMDLDEDATGKGFGTAFNYAMESYCRRSGADRMTVLATDAGAYSMARAGYDFDPTPELLKSSVSSITNKINSIYPDCTPADRALLDDVLRRFQGRVIEYPSPSELAALTGEDRELGRTLMKGTAWHGLRVL